MMIALTNYPLTGDPNDVLETQDTMRNGLWYTLDVHARWTQQMKNSNNPCKANILTCAFSLFVADINNIVNPNNIIKHISIIIYLHTSWLLWLLKLQVQLES